MGKIFMNEMVFYGYHGVMEEENRIGQNFIIDVELDVDLSVSAKSDNVMDTVSYADVYLDIKMIVEEKQFKLIERLANEIALQIFGKYEKVKEIKVKVLKPEAPINGKFHSFGVEICRKR